VYLSCGWDAVRKFIANSFADLVNETKSGQAAFDHKTRLQELLQAEGRRPPEYRTVETLGLPHQRVFVVEARSNGQVIGTGRGTSKQEAEQTAAGEALASRDEWLPHISGSA